MRWKYTQQKIAGGAGGNTAREWQAIDDRKFGVGDISLAGGQPNSDHASHKNGLQLDVRPMRKDGQHQPVSFWEEQYDKAATAKLIELFRIYAPVIRIYFNGPDIPFVIPRAYHDNHFHVELRG